MSKDDTKKTSTKSKNAANVIKSIAWLVEAAFRGFVGYVLLTKVNSTVAVVAGLYALLTAAMIVVKHFVDAHK